MFVFTLKERKKRSANTFDNSHKTPGHDTKMQSRIFLLRELVLERSAGNESISPLVQKSKTTKKNNPERN